MNINLCAYVYTYAYTLQTTGTYDVTGHWVIVWTVSVWHDFTAARIIFIHTCTYTYCMNIICMTWIYSRILMSMNITCVTFIPKSCHPYNVHTSVAWLYSRTYNLHTHLYLCVWTGHWVIVWTLYVWNNSWTCNWVIVWTLYVWHDFTTLYSCLWTLYVWNSYKSHVIHIMFIQVWHDFTAARIMFIHICTHTLYAWLYDYECITWLYTGSYTRHMRHVTL